jgi:hypothetical protein
MKPAMNPFSTLNLVRIACALAGVLFMKALSAYYGFSWLTAIAHAQ